MNDLELPKEGFWWLFRNFDCSAHFNSELRQNDWK